MAVIKCKMCGGDLNITEGLSVVECEYCGSRQTIPTADNEKKMTLFARAGRLLRGCEFDKASGVFESIVADFPEEAEAYWGLVLCKYGIEYVDDPATGKKVPTCHCSSFDSVLDDPNYEQACENGDVIARRVYREEARQIEELRKGIIEVSGKEAPYDIFISYKETDDRGSRTLDSVIAQDIYKELTGEGYRVFFSRVSLEDKLGTEYEPYIFAALNSAKVMLVVGTDYEHFDSVWVKNEWSRFLKLISSGQKKVLIPVFKNMDPYDMPKEFAKLSAQDMGKVGAMQDLLRGVEKIVGKKKPETVKETVVVQQGEGSMKTAAAVKRGYLALEEGEFDDAKEFFNQALTLDAECAEAYLGLALANEQEKNEDAYIQNSCAKKGSKEALEIPPELRRIDKVTAYNYIPNFLSTTELKNIFDFNLKYLSAVKTQTEIAKQEKARFENNRNLNRAFRFAKGETAERLESFKTRLFEGLDRNVATSKEEADAACVAKEKAYAAHLQAGEEKAAALHKQAEKTREAFYQAACKAQTEASSITDYEAVQDDFRKLGIYYDASERVQQCQLSIQQLQEQQRLKKEAEEKAAAEEAERQRVLDEKHKMEIRKKQKKAAIVVGIIAALALAVFLVWTKVIIPLKRYNAATEQLSIGEYPEAAMLYYQAGDYKDSKARYIEAGQKAGMHHTVSAGFLHTVGLKSDGTVVTVGNNGTGQCDVSDWTDIVAVSAGGFHTVGLKSDGTVVAVGSNYDGRCDVSRWKDIVAVSAGDDHTVGLKSDGTVVAVGEDKYGRCDVRDWTDIVAISAGSEHTVGLKSDGTVVAVGNNDNGQCDVSYWTDIVAVSAGELHTVGLKSDGTGVAVGYSDDGQCDVSDWTDIVAVSAETWHTVGLKSDGTVVSVGEDKYGQCDVSRWTDIVAISANTCHTVGLKSDGTVVATKYSGNSMFNYGQCNVSGWSDIRVPGV